VQYLPLLESMRDESVFGPGSRSLRYETARKPKQDAEIPSTIGTYGEANDMVKAKRGKGLGSAE
jgi:hypothetical protein